MPATATITYAALHVFKTTELPFTSAELAFYRNEGTFNEGTVTWNNQPLVELSPSPVAWDVPNVPDWATLDVTSFTVDCRVSRGNVCSWQIRWINEVDNGVAGELIRSREFPTEFRPYLEVRYTP